MCSSRGGVDCPLSTRCHDACGAEVRRLPTCDLPAALHAAVVCGLCLAVVGHSAKAVAGVSARESLSLAEEAAALAAGMSSTGPTRSAPAPAAGGQEGSAAGAAAAAAAATVGGAASGGKAAQPRAAAKSLRELIAQAALQGKAPLWVLSLTNTSMACLAAGFLFGAYEPMLGVWWVACCAACAQHTCSTAANPLWPHFG